MDNAADEWARLCAYGTQLIEAHMRLRDMMDDMRDGVVPAAELATHCLAFCEALTRHHTTEDQHVFPLLAERHPELRAFLGELRRDHNHIAWLLGGLGDDPDRERLDEVAAVMETHFRGEEKRLTDVLNAIAPGELPALL